MTDVHENVDHAQRPSWDRAFCIALRSLMIAWIVAFVLVFLAVSMLAGEMLFASCVIGVASGAIAAFSMLPGLFSGGGGKTEFPRAAMFGILPRLAGTVALFLLCRYHFAASAESIASLTIGWYLFLTSVEVVTLSRELPKADRIHSLISLSTDP